MAGFEPATRCLQIRRQLNSTLDFLFPCIPRTSIEYKEFHSGGYHGGYRKQSTKLATDAPLLFGRALKKLAQRDRCIVLLVQGTVRQCDGTLPCQGKQVMKLLLTLGSPMLRVLPPPEFIPATGIL